MFKFSLKKKHFSDELVPVDVDLLQKAAGANASNEFQRFFNLLKASAPCLASEDFSRRVTFGDWKCPISQFLERAEAKSGNIVTLTHPWLFGKPLREEFHATKCRMKERRESGGVFSDIYALEKFLGPEALNKKIPMYDIKCMQWRGPRTSEFSQWWTWYTAAFTMCPQLTFDAAIRNCSGVINVTSFRS